jgi:shikimate dehydrogenase
LGAGGACRAVFMALGWSGAKKISVAARKIDKAEQLIREGKLYIESKTECVSLSHIPVQTLKEASLIVNTTPIGMYPYENNLPPIAFELLQPTQYICDLIYNPLETQFLAKAKLKGCKVVNGVGMLVHQGAKTFSLFTDKKAPIEEMRQVVLDYVSKSRKVLP